MTDLEPTLDDEARQEAIRRLYDPDSGQAVPGPISAFVAGAAWQRHRDKATVTASAPRIGLDDDGTLDEFVLDHPDQIHFEAMSDNRWWIGIYQGDRWWHINCGAVNDRARGYAHIQENP